MKILDKILYQRLDKIRDELNSYIAGHTASIYSEVPIPPSSMRHENTDGFVEKCLNVMPLKEDEEELSKKSISMCRPSAPVRQMSAPPQQMSSARPVEIAIPEFLRSECKKRTIDEVLKSKAETFSSMLLRLIDEKGLKDSEVYKKANIDRRLFSKIRGDEDYVPSKKTAISFCLALQLEMDEAKKLLETAGYTLSTSSRFDLIIMYLIENEEYNIHFANIVLEDYGEGTLSK